MGGAEEVKPYNDEEAKGKQVGEMFDAIAPSYDFMNTMMTGGLHKHWRNKALKMAAKLLEDARGQGTEDRGQRPETRGQMTDARDQRTGDRGQGTEDRGRGTEARGQRPDDRCQGTEARGQMTDARGQGTGDRGQGPERILDVACGTGDVTFKMHKMFPKASITGLDLSPGMLWVAKGKLEWHDAETQKLITFMEGDCLRMPFADRTFDMVTVAYGVRNFERLEDGYREMRRVLKPGGVLCVIELSEPSNPLIKSGYRLYSRNVIPFIGKMVSKDTRAYSYLPESIAACPQRGDMTAMMERAGFKDASFKSLTLGVITIYLAKA